VTKAFVTFPEYVWAKNAEEKIKYLYWCFQYGGWKIDTQLEKAGKSCVEGLFGF